MDNTVLKPWQKHGFILAGYICFALGFIGIFLPLLPTTVFWILAAWLWMRGGSKRVDYILNHPYFGKGVRQFLEAGVISKKGKTAAIVGMTTSIAIWTYFIRPELWLLLCVVLPLGLVIIWLLSRPTE
jgi:uncharacterized membrane protein YbaN (DUF454 family)